MNRMAVLWLVLAVVAGALLFKTSQQVTDGRQHLANITADIRREEDSLRVLQAEWSYLNQPDRLEKLSAQYLKLSPMKGKQFAKADSLPLRPVPETPAPAETAELVAAITTESVITSAAADTAAAVEETASIAPAAGMAAPAITPPVPMRKPAGLKAPPAAVIAPAPAATKPVMPPQPAAPKPAATTASAAPADSSRSFGDVLNSLGGGF